MEVTINKTFYDYTKTPEEQENAIIFYENTYMQNSGVDYGMNEEFDVISILDGTVMEVIDDEIMGKTIKIKHFPKSLYKHSIQDRMKESKFCFD